MKKFLAYLQAEKKSDLEAAHGELGNDFYYYEHDDLGVNYSVEKTVFRVWAPTADRIELLLFKQEESQVADLKYEMEVDIGGTWLAEVAGDQAGRYFIYQVYLNGKINQVVDPYTRGLSSNSLRGLVVDLAKTNPPGWEQDRRYVLKQPQDAVIYEVHLRDFSSSPHSGLKYKGKYLAFTETGTRSPTQDQTGLDHLAELGITHIQLQPVFDFATVDDYDCNHYNWGYDPYFYNVPEGSYSTNPSDSSRIKEFKEMVKAIHERGFGIIMDVVYNHTYYTEESPFNLLVPGYYYRFDEYGHYSNGSGTGNEIASEKPMVRKFIVDSVKYWAREYHIDGFRFDLMALHDKETMLQIERVLHVIDPSILLYGEPWMGGLSPLDSSQQLLKGVQRGMKLAVFNDHFRNAIKGDNDGMGTGFVSGACHQELAIQRGIVGSISYNHDIRDFTEQPWETINYVSSHDNLTLWDKINKSNGWDSEQLRIKMDRLAQAIIFTAQGIPFMQGGEEILRTKWGEHNSYQAGDQVNQLKWERKSKYSRTFKYYQGLIKLRREHPAFRLKDAEQIRKHLHFLAAPANTVAFMLKDYANQDRWQVIVVLFNPNRETVIFNLPGGGSWQVVVSGDQAGTKVLQTLEGEQAEVEPLTTMVLYQN
ncbi:MAG: type I pullulanase [Halanaerobiales bacterium]|nr:type I pullulanase [Halanaerobiales bacterium]